MIRILTLFVLVTLNVTTQAQVADWADDGLTVRDGLRLWLDATRLNAGRKANGAAELASGDLVGNWLGAVGTPRDAVQDNESARPELIAVGDSRVIRFDGEDDHFRIVGTGGKLQSATIFIVGAPHSNPGNFRGLFATNAPEQRDYESGLTVDLGPGPTQKFSQLNIEGIGFGGARNLRNGTSEFGTLHILETLIDSDAKLVQLNMDGVAEDFRPLDPGDLSFEQITVGARFVNIGAGPQKVHGPFRGDLAELIVFDRILKEQETQSVRTYLQTKYAKLTQELPKTLNLTATAGVPLVKAENPSAVQMLLPGFSVHEVPVELTNVNNVRYRSDGKLVTLGYNGDIHLLSDTDGDGVEDRAELFWKNSGSIRGPIGIHLTPPGYARGNGVFVPSKGKVSLIVDTNGDDKADEEIIVAQGWKEIFTTVDALGITMDKENNIYFGLGVANFADAYQIDKNGKSSYDLHADNGTIQKVSADFSKRETVCTGIRFPVAMAFNREGDLFCTEQEGATWLPNGNPLDELLHIRLDGVGPNSLPGQQRHYGFPPRHPRHNPNVIDEPSTFDYAPQHQSTCGMVFNESVNEGPVFGPDGWAGDAIVCGESRGKLWRTTLVKTRSGYVAATQLFAALQMLTVDACVAPDGDLIVACHSGPPDWGTGPTGIGKLYRICMTQPDAARPVATWAESLQEIRIAFDKPLEATQLRQLTEEIRIDYGTFVRAGDRFENLVPPYAVVQAQQIQPRYSLPVTGVAVTNDLRTLLISTAPMSLNAHYSITIPTKTTRPFTDSTSALPQHTEMDVDFALHGLQATWKPDDGNATPAWSGWLPHPDLKVCRTLLHNSAGHASLFEALQTQGTLILQSKLNVHNILRPAVQPGASIDYEWPAEEATVAVTSSHDVVLQASRPGVADQPATELTVVCDQTDGEMTRATFSTSADLVDPIDVVVAMRTGGDNAPELSISVWTNEDSDPRPLPLHRFQLPWVSGADTNRTADTLAERKIAELEGGSWARGRRVFRSEAAGCFKCHSVGGGGAKIGPDLVNLVHRDYASVLRDVMNPGFAINPDYIGHVIALDDGRVLTGVLQTDGDQLLLGDEKGGITKLQRSDIESFAPSRTSVMPTGIAEKLTTDQLKDLLTYLMTKAPHMPLDSPLTAPPLRTQAEVAQALAGSQELPETLRPLNVILVDGVKDHGPGEHDYPAWKAAWLELLSVADNVTVTGANEFPSDQQLASADVVIFFQKGSFEDPRPEKLDAFLAGGGGAVYIHWAVNGNDQVQAFSKRIGYASWGGRIAFRHGPLTLDIHNTDHPIVRNFDQIQLYDESYWKLTGNPANVTLLATSTEDGMATTQMWTTEQGSGRVFVSIPGHYNWTFDDPLFRVLLLRGIAWTAKEPVDRFNELVPIGARMSR